MQWQCVSRPIRSGFELNQVIVLLTQIHSFVRRFFFFRHSATTRHDYSICCDRHFCAGFILLKIAADAHVGCVLSCRRCNPNQTDKFRSALLAYERHFTGFQVVVCFSSIALLSGLVPCSVQCASG